jgi:hypothetical protein
MVIFSVSRPRRGGNQSVFDAFRDFQAEASMYSTYYCDNTMRFNTVLT